MKHNKLLKTAIFLMIVGTGIYSYTLVLASSSTQIIQNNSAPAPLPPPPPSRPKPTVIRHNFTVISPGLLSYDPLQNINDVIPFINGKLAYAGNFSQKDVEGKANWSPYLFFRSVENGRTTTNVIIKPDKPGSSYIFSPQFSPDGRCIAFGYGWPFDSHGEYQVPVVDVLSGKMISTIHKDATGKGKFLAYRNFYWSPNSKIIAYIRGGDQDGNEYSLNFPISLYLHNIVNDSDHYIASNPYVTHLAWTPENTLLYCKIPKSEIGNISPKNCKIFEVSSDGGPSKLIINGGFDPKPSPDGRYIVYFGWPQDNHISTNDNKEEENKNEVQQQIGLYLFNRESGKKTLLLSPVSHYTFINMLWTPNSNEIIFLKFLSRSPHAVAEISKINIKDKTSHVITTIESNDFMKLPRPRNNPEINPECITPDGRFLIVKVSEGISSDAPLIIEKGMLEAVNLITGKIIKGAAIMTAFGYDWWSGERSISPVSHDNK